MSGFKLFEVKLLKLLFIWVWTTILVIIMHRIFENILVSYVCMHWYHCAKHAGENVEIPPIIFFDRRITSSCDAEKTEGPRILFTGITPSEVSRLTEVCKVLI